MALNTYLDGFTMRYFTFSYRSCNPFISLEGHNCIESMFAMLVIEVVDQCLSNQNRLNFGLVLIDESHGEASWSCKLSFLTIAIEWPMFFLESLRCIFSANSDSKQIIET